MHLTDKSDHRVGHLNTILARGAGINYLNDPIFKMSNALALTGVCVCVGWGVLKFRVDRRIINDVVNKREPTEI